MKSYRTIENIEVRNQIIELLGLFEDSFLNDELEFVAIHYFYFRKHYIQQALWSSKALPLKKKMPKRPIMVNLYFLTSNCHSKKDVQRKVLEYFSRDCTQTLPKTSFLKFTQNLGAELIEPKQLNLLIRVLICAS